MSAYITLVQFREAVGLTDVSDTRDDGVMRSCITRASAYVDEYLRQNRPGYVGFAAGSNTHSAVGSNTRYYDGTGHDTLWIDDAASVASVVVDSTTVSTDAYTAWPYNEVPKRSLIYDLPTVGNYGVTTTHWTQGTANVAVTGYFGLPFVPDDVAQVTLAVSLILWRRNQRADYEGTSGVLSSQRFSAGSGRQFQYAIDPEIAAALSSLDAGWAVGGVWGG